MAASYQAMLATALIYARGDAASRVAAWRQIVDIVGQARGGLDPDARTAAFAALTTLSPEVTVAQRRLAAASLAGRIADVALVAVFAHDVPVVAAPVLGRLVLSDGDWGTLIPGLPSASRNILRNRRDLPEQAARLLARFAAGDSALPAPDALATSAMADGGTDPLPGATPILDLVQRIAEYRLQKNDGSALPTLSPAADQFAFETDNEGVVAWVDGVARAAIIGISLADAAPPGGAGVDAAAAGAWRRRARLGPCRLWVAGEGAASGDWTIEAAALFNPRDGRFVGYRGDARRPKLGERASAGPGAESDVGTDSIRQLVHELRTPLNAIQGFAAMIDGQLLGPAASAHRSHARAIVAEAERLVGLIDDLDLAARLDAGRGVPVAAPVPLSVAVARAAGEQRSVLAERGIALRVTGADENGDEKASDGGASSVIDRIVSRLLTAVAATAAHGDVIDIVVQPGPMHQVASIMRPTTLRGVETSVLLDPDFEPEGAWPDASLLGLGFTLRLCARLAIEQGGRLAILPDAFELTLPTAGVADFHIAR